MRTFPIPRFTSKIVARESFVERIKQLPRPFVFTNGCFDILHRGHVTYLDHAASLGHSLLVGVNSDASVQRLGKAPDRPINPLADRLTVLAALSSVSIVVPFDEDTPLALILSCRPDVLVKGGDWTVEQIIGGKEVQSWGGQVISIPYLQGHSTTELLQRIRR